jgi:hypothetical protein
MRKRRKRSEYEKTSSSKSELFNKRQGKKQMTEEPNKKMDIT